MWICRDLWPIYTVLWSYHIATRSSSGAVSRSPLFVSYDIYRFLLTRLSYQLTQGAGITGPRFERVQK